MIRYLASVYMLIVSCLVFSAYADNPCTLTVLVECMRSFQKFYDLGIDILANPEKENTTAVQICRKYDAASRCLSPLMYSCPEFKAFVNTKFENFQYACDRLGDPPVNWPYFPTAKPDPHDGEIEEAVEASDKDDIRATAIKACVAAGVTILLIMVCVVAEVVTRYKVWHRLRRLTASAATQSEPLVQEEDVPATEPEDIKKEKV